MSEGVTDISIATAIAGDGDVGDEADDVDDDGGKNANGEHGDVEDGGKDVDDEDEIGELDSSGLSVEQQTISSVSVICEDVSIVEVEPVTFLFLKDERKNE